MTRSYCDTPDIPAACEKRLSRLEVYQGELVKRLAEHREELAETRHELEKLNKALSRHGAFVAGAVATVSTLWAAGIAAYQIIVRH